MQIRLLCGRPIFVFPPPSTETETTQLCFQHPGRSGFGMGIKLVEIAGTSLYHLHYPVNFLPRRDVLP